MEWNEEQKANILRHYNSIEEYEKIAVRREAEKYLADTDYILIKLFEYTLTGKASLTDYKDVFKKREEAREKIRGLEKTENTETTEDA